MNEENREELTVEDLLKKKKAEEKGIIIKEKKVPSRFWDDLQQKTQAHYYAKKNKVSLKDEATKIAIRDMLRERVVKQRNLTRKEEKPEIKKIYLKTSPPIETLEEQIEQKKTEIKMPEKVISLIKGNPKFWDSDTQRQRGFYYAKKNRMDLKDPAQRESIRTVMRAKEASKKKYADKMKEELKKYGMEETGKDVKPIKQHKESKAQTFRSRMTILSQSIEQALESGPLPPPTGYDSKDGTCWDNPNDLLHRKRVSYFDDDKKGKVLLPNFGDDDIAWIEFFLGDPETGGTLLRPKKKSDFKELKEKKLLGKLYNIQKKMSDYLDENPWSKFEVWRGAGKTVISIGKILRKMCDNPNECFFLQSETDDKTIQRIRVLKRELQTNQKIIAFYGYLPADSSASGGKRKELGKDYKGKWAEGLIELKREYSGIEPTLMGISWNTGRGVGYHFTGGILDDPWSGHNQGREGDYDKFWSWWGEFYGSLEYASFVWVLCTKKGQDDIYTKMDEEKMFACFREKLVIEFPDNYKLIEKNGAYIGAEVINKDPNKQYINDECFGKYTIESALLIRQKIGIEMFEREFQNNPRRIEGKLLSWNKVHKCVPDSVDRYSRLPFHNKDQLHVRGCIVYDPAFGLSESAFDNALVAMWEYERRIYILRIWKGHWTKDQRVKAFLEARSLFPNFPFYCEDAFQQLNIVRDLTATTGISLRPFSPKEKGMKYIELFNGHKHASKKAKIYDGIEPVVEDERLYIVESTPYIKDFEDEFKNFPDVLKMDTLDAVSMGCFILDRRIGNQMALDSSYVSRDSFLPAGASIANVFQIGKRFS